MESKAVTDPIDPIVTELQNSIQNSSSILDLLNDDDEGIRSLKAKFEMLKTQLITSDSVDFEDAAKKMADIERRMQLYRKIVACERRESDSFPRQAPLPTARVAIKNVIEGASIAEPETGSSKARKRERPLYLLGAHSSEPIPKRGKTGKAKREYPQLRCQLCGRQTRHWCERCATGYCRGNCFALHVIMEESGMVQHATTTQRIIPQLLPRNSEATAPAAATPAPAPTTPAGPVPTAAPPAKPQPQPHSLNPLGGMDDQTPLIPPSTMASSAGPEAPRS